MGVVLLWKRDQHTQFNYNLEKTFEVKNCSSRFSIKHDIRKAISSTVYIIYLPEVTSHDIVVS